MSRKPLASWGRFPAVPQTPHPCHWRGETGALLRAVGMHHGSTLPFGNGRSYGDSCLADSGHVLCMRPLDRFISIDWDSGLLCAEAGVTLGEILALAIPRGWFLPVTPGTQYVTLGGAVANDVHGKNHHVRGTFGCHVRRLVLARSDRDDCDCSATKNADLFNATIGGLGLTGVIKTVTLQLIPVRSSIIDTLSVRFDSLAEFFALSAELDPLHEYSVSWIDCTARGAAMGRGVFSAGNHAITGGLAVANARRRSVPFTPPLSLVNAVSLRGFNWAYFHAHAAGRRNGRTPHEPFFYPLDRLLYWNRLYGPRGFQQYQCVIPDATAEDAIAHLLRAISASGGGSFLAVLKRCGGIRSPGLLSFPLPGVSLALDFPQNGQLATLLRRLDDIAREAGGRLYPAKDAHMTGADFRHFYPRWEEVEALRDPALLSRFWARVTRT